LIPQNSLDSLEFSKLLEIIARYANSDASQRSILSITPLDSKEEIEKRFSCIEEIRLLSQKGKPLNILPFKDIAPALQEVRPEDAVLEPLELVGIMDFLFAALGLAGQIKSDSVLYALNELAANLTGKPELLRMLKKSIDREGAILDSASPLLSELRSQKKRLETKIRKRLEEITRDEGVALFLQDSFITQRSGRWVVPVRMDSKGQVAGVVHDVSKSGDTAFIEPIGIISISNELENIIADEKTEEIRILRVLSSHIRSSAGEMEEEFRVVVYLDVLNSIAVFAEQYGMQAPLISGENSICMVNARHPLLLAASKDRDGIVPVDLSLGGESRVMVITGPNAGGKTVAIKTVGLVAAMALSGMPVTADSSTMVPMLNNLLVDIGDRQSIEDHLSTFTAHLENIAGILKGADSGTLVLIDELGTGTDPEEGAALSCAILKELRERGALTFTTTHLTDIKAFVHKSEGMVNASMEFDNKTHTPLYKLRVGEPGQSYAIETARRYGLPKHIIESAKNLLGRRNAELDSLIQEFHEKRRHYEESLKDLHEQHEKIREREHKLIEMIRDAETKNREMLSKTYKEASGIILNTKRQMNSLLEELKRRDKEAAKEALKEVASAYNEVEEKIKEYSIEETEAVSMDEISEGATVFVKSLGYDATVVKILRRENRLRVRMGNKDIEVPIHNVGLRRGRPVETGIPGIKVETADETVSARINVIGLRVDEALSMIEPFLNRAVLSGLGEVVIIHGIGAGILSKNIREYLSGHPLVKDFREGAQTEGGAGVTIVALK
jgi:DNA mismatch repair protein MutS2